VLRQGRRTITRFIAAVPAFISIVFSVAVVRAAEISYQWVNDPADQLDLYLNNGTVDTLTGGITTDGPIGTLSGSDVVSWACIIGNQVSGFESFSSDGGSLGFEGLVATPTQLILLQDNDGIQAIRAHPYYPRLKLRPSLIREIHLIRGLLFWPA
jgi:hypothetical protein